MSPGHRVGLHLLSSDLLVSGPVSEQSSQLSRVGGQQGGRRAGVVEQGQRTGIDHTRIIGLDRTADAVDLTPRSHTGVVGVHARPEDPALHAPLGRHRLRDRLNHEPRRCGGPDVTHQPGPGLDGGGACQDRCPREGLTAGDDAHHAPRILVVPGRRHRPQIGHVVVLHPLDRRTRGDGQADVHHRQQAHCGLCVRQQVDGLSYPESDRFVGEDRGGADPVTAGVDSTRQIDRQHVTVIADGPDEGGHRSGQPRPPTDADECIEHDVGG